MIAWKWFVAMRSIGVESNFITGKMAGCASADAVERKTIKIISFIRFYCCKQSALMRLMPMLHFNIPTERCQKVFDELATWVEGEKNPNPCFIRWRFLSWSFASRRSLRVYTSIWICLTRCYFAVIILWILLLHLVRRCRVRIYSWRSN